MRSFVAVVTAAAALAAVPGALAAGSSGGFAATVEEILAQPYQPAYLPLGLDSAFDTPVPNTAPAQDYTSGSIPGSPDAPAWPADFRLVTIASADGAKLFARVALHSVALSPVALSPATHPGIVVAHGFNTHGFESVIRWAAMLYARGYNVIASDQRDFYYESQAGYGYPAFPQTFGWKESEDVLAAGRYLAAQPGVGAVGLVGFSEGAQNAVLALALDRQSRSHLFSAGLTFSGPADQDTQVYGTAVPTACRSPFCTYPVTDALVSLVVPNETTVCGALADAATAYGTTGFTILAHESPVHAQTAIRVPLLNVYAADDTLVSPLMAELMAAYESGNPVQRTVELRRGEHAYFYDRWWQQRAILLYFKAMLPHAAGDVTIGADATVLRTAGGAPASEQTVPLGPTSRAWADAQLAPYICDTTQGAPGLASP
jgi:predicted alpha/beta-fold hydrolase